MKMRSSSWISAIILAFIPLSWAVEYFANILIHKRIMAAIRDTETIRDYEFMFIDIPVSQLVILATVVIPAIFVRKLVREGTTNLTMPVGKNGKDEI